MERLLEELERIDTAWLWSAAGQFFLALLVFVIGRWVVMAVTRLTERVMERRGLDPMLVSFIGRIFYIVLLVTVVISAIAVLGMPITPMLAILGGAALAVGLALQNSLSNFASGVMLIANRPFTVGHFVEAGGVSGTVEKVGIFQTTLRTPDNRSVVVPNTGITTAPITDYTAFDTRRIDMMIGVSYGDDLKTARRVMEEVIANHSKVLDEPAPVVLLMELGDSSVDFAVRPWVATLDYWVVRNELLEQIKAALEAAGCSIPFPQRDLHLHQEAKNS